VSYRAEWDYQNPDGRWQADAIDAPAIFRTQRQFYSFDFVGAQPGRWRVWAVDPEGREGSRSAWRRFEFKR
jgi:eukaryotic-like serine/threonine-protein kinase